MPRSNIPPLVNGVPIVNSMGAPTPQFIQIWQQLFGNVDVNFNDVESVEAVILALQTDVTALQTDVTALQTDVDAIEVDVTALQAAIVPPGGALNDVLTKDSSADYDMSWQPGGGGGSGWTLASTTNIAAPTPNVDVTGLGTPTEIMVVLDAVIASPSGSRWLRYSIDNGSTYFNTVGNYVSTTANANPLDQSEIALGSAGTAARTAGAVLHAGNTAAAFKPVSMIGGGAIGVGYFFKGSSAQVNAIRVLASTGNLTGGTIYVFTR